MTTLLNKKIDILEKFQIIPSGLNIPIDLSIVDVRATSYEYYENKYAAFEHYDNKAVTIKFEHSQVEKPFWITIFEGATYREEDTRCVIATFKQTIDDNFDLDWSNGTFYPSDCITEDESVFDGYDVLKQIVFAFKCKLFNGDESGLYTTEESTFKNNSNFMNEVTEALMNESFVQINEKISRNNPQTKQLQYLNEILHSVAKGKLYQITVIHDNCIKIVNNFLEKEDAEKIFITYCKEYYNMNGLESYADRLNLTTVEELTLAQLEVYFGSSEWQDVNDISNVDLKLM